MVQVEIMTQLRVKTLLEPSLLLGVRRHLLCGIAAEVLNLFTISINIHLTLGETTKLFYLEINEGLRNVMLAKSLGEISLGRYLARWNHRLIVRTPKTNSTLQMICSIVDLVTCGHIR